MGRDVFDPKELPKPLRKLIEFLAEGEESRQSIKDVNYFIRANKQLFQNKGLWIMLRDIRLRELVDLNIKTGWVSLKPQNKKEGDL